MVLPDRSMDFNFLFFCFVGFLASKIKLWINKTDFQLLFTSIKLNKEEEKKKVDKLFILFHFSFYNNFHPPQAEKQILHNTQYVNTGTIDED